MRLFGDLTFARRTHGRNELFYGKRHADTLEHEAAAIKI
jgi:hypothetical protein